MSDNKLPYRSLQDQSFGNLLAILVNSVCCLADNLPSGGGVESVTATNDSIVVNNTDPLNPVVGLPYLVYRALLNQSGTDAPTAIVLENTLGEVPTFGYTNPGEYTLNTVGNVFTTNKTFILVKSTPNFDPSLIFYAWAAAETFVLLNVGNAVGVNFDGEFNNTSIEILVYP